MTAVTSTPEVAVPPPSLSSSASSVVVFPVPPSKEDGDEVRKKTNDTHNASPKGEESLFRAKSEEGVEGGDDDSEFVLPRCELPPPSELQVVETCVEKAVREQDELSETAAPIKTYKVLLDAIRLKKDIDMLRKLLIAFRTSGHGSTLHRLTSSKKHARLIHPVLRLNPFELPTSAYINNPASTPLPLLRVADYDLADAQLHFLSAVVSSNAVFLVPTVTFAWKLLTSQYENVPVERKRRCHAFLATILRMVPKAKSEIFPLMSSCAPYRTRDVSEIVHYYQNCLIVLRYHPGLQTPLLDLMVDKCLEMDVEIKISDLGEAAIDKDDKEVDDTTALFELDLEDHAEANPQKTTDAANNALNVTVDEMANKLDALMMILFEYISQSSLSLTVLYDIFARVFESSILICYKSKFVQYLLFYLCGLHGSAEHETPVLLYRDFLTKLIHIVLDPYRATATRQSGACYVASFVSRSRFVTPETVCEAVSALLRWAEAYLQSLDAAGGTTGSTSLSSVTAEDSREQCHLHSLFYTVCQSAFYIMCFRGNEAITFFRQAVESAQDDEGVLQHVDISLLRWSKICSHSTQPLRFCLESVRVEFLTLARTHSLLDATILDSLEQQGRASLTGKSRKTVNVIRTAATLEKERLSGGVGGLGRGQNPLDSFFPFDPYLLRQSYSFIEPFYIHWCGVTGESGSSSGVDMDNALDDTMTDAPRAVDDDDLSEEAENGESSDEEDDDSKNDDEAIDHGDGGEDDDDDSQAQSSEIEPMSYASTSSIVKFVSGSPDVAAKREELRTAWTDTLKRSRAPSIENGSW